LPLVPLGRRIRAQLLGKFFAFRKKKPPSDFLLPLVPLASFVFSYGKIAQFFHTKKQRKQEVQKGSKTFAEAKVTTKQRELWKGKGTHFLKSKGPPEKQKQQQM